MTESPAIRHEKPIHLVLRRHFRRSFAVLARHGFAYEDLVQEGRYAILRAEPNYDPAGCAESTFYSRAVYNWIGSRVCTRHLQRQKRRLNGATISLDDHVRTQFNRDDDDGLKLGNTLRAPGGVDENRIADAIELERALEHLRGHSVKQYAAVRMRFYDDFDNYQIAAALGCSKQFASLCVLNGLKYLRGIYGVNEGGKTA